MKDVINSGGVLVASRQVEDVLYAHPAVAEVAVIGLPDERWIEAVTAVVVLKQDVEPDALIELRQAASRAVQGPEIGACRRRATQERLRQATEARAAPRLRRIGISRRGAT